MKGQSNNSMRVTRITLRFMLAPYLKWWAADVPIASTDVS